jgi:Flp pilus assembly protein CpaB
MFKNFAISERLRNVVIAVALAGFAGMLTLFYVSNYKENVQAAEENVSVLVATKDIPAGTPGEDALDDKLVVAKEVEQKAVVPGSFTEPAQIEKLLTTDKIYAGEQITATRFRPEAQRGPRAELTGTMRAIQVPATANQVLSGTLSEGDHVDVVASIEYKVVTGARDFERTATRVILRDILVLKTQKADPLSNVTDSGDKEMSIQLALTDTQAQKLFFAMNSGEWTLVLRPPARSADSPESVEVVETVLGDGLRPRQVLHLAGRGGIR